MAYLSIVFIIIASLRHHDGESSFACLSRDAGFHSTVSTVSKETHSGWPPLAINNAIVADDIGRFPLIGLVHLVTGPPLAIRKCSLLGIYASQEVWVKFAYNPAAV